MSRGAGRRHRGRELALRVLFEVEGTAKDPEEALVYQARELGATEDVAGFARELVDGTLRRIDDVDSAIGSATTNWRLPELGKVERAVLRLGTFELVAMPETPAAVVIDESVELAKAYAGEEAAHFVNGVLGQIAGVRR